MVNSCAAYGCYNRFKKDSNIRFHRFPINNPELCKKWKIAVKRKNFEPKKHTTICSEHFLPTDYNFNSDNSVSNLKINACPSVFVFSSNSKTKRKAPTKRTPPP